VFFIVCLSSVVSCNKNSNTTTVNIIVTDGDSGTAANNATVYLYDSGAAVATNSPKYTQGTDQSGKAKITVASLSTYFIVVQKGTEKNYYGGYIPVGIFKSQTDIDDNPRQTPPAVVGGVKFKDVNGDGQINSQDITPMPSINIVANTNNSESVTIY
jgi:hypothetical protein